MSVMPLNQAFTARAIGLNWDNYKASLGEAPYLGRTKFGTTKKMGLKLAHILGENAMPVALKASNFDAQAPLRDGIGFSTIENQMPFFRESIMVTEQEQQEYDTFVDSNNVAYANQILANIMKKPLDLVRGANVVPERMIWQLLVPSDGVPKIDVIVDGGQRYVIDYTADNGAIYKQKHFKNISLSDTDKWTAHDTATPLADLIQIKQQFGEDTGYSLVTFTMNSTTFNMILNAEDTKKQVMGAIAYNAGIRMKKADVVQYLAEEGISIEVYDKMFMPESGEATKFIPDGMISAQASGVYLGTVTYGTTPEERSGSIANGSLSIVDTGVAVYTYGTEHPVNTHTVVSEIVLPTFEGMNGTCVIKVA